MGRQEGEPILEQKISRRDLLKQLKPGAKIAVASFFVQDAYQGVRPSVHEKFHFLEDTITHNGGQFVNPLDLTKKFDEYSLIEDTDDLWGSIFQDEKKSVFEPTALEVGAENELFSGSITTTGLETPVDLTFVSTREYSNVAFHPLIIKANGLSLFVPYVTSPQPTRISTQLGEFLQPGLHNFSVEQLDGYDQLSPDEIKLEFSLPQGNSTQAALRKTSAMYAIRPNNLRGLEEYILHDPLYRKIRRAIGREKRMPIDTDAPMISYEKISVHKDGDRIRRDSNIIFKNEERGLTAGERFKTYQRVPDVESSIRDVLDVEFFKRIESYDQRANHKTAKNHSKVWHEHPILQIKTNNNCFSDEQEVSLLYFPVPNYLEGELFSDAVIADNPALIYLAFQDAGSKPLPMGLPDGKERAEKVLETMRLGEVQIYPATPKITNTLSSQ